MVSGLMNVEITTAGIDGKPLIRPFEEGKRLKAFGYEQHQRDPKKKLGVTLPGDMKIQYNDRRMSLIALKLTENQVNLIRRASAPIPIEFTDKQIAHIIRNFPIEKVRIKDNEGKGLILRSKHIRGNNHVLLKHNRTLVFGTPVPIPIPYPIPEHKLDGFISKSEVAIKLNKYQIKLIKKIHDQSSEGERDKNILVFTTEQKDTLFRNVPPQCVRVIGVIDNKENEKIKHPASFVRENNIEFITEHIHEGNIVVLKCFFAHVFVYPSAEHR
jgi:hypothetical protein